MRKQLVALTLSAAMAAGMLSGCGGIWFWFRRTEGCGRGSRNGSGGGGHDRGCRQ